ncbi:MAG: sporulation integral membrane protein YtvI [Clostridia bacterium]|jgi:sporulation integral membrane protein YtvI|nr:sporulation integral membrane protein YtvI [Clostridia bacterium]
MEDKHKYYLKMLSKFAIALFIIIMMFMAYKIAIFYMPFLIALIISSLTEPLIRLLINKTKMKRKLASIIALLLIVTLIITILAILITNLITESSKLINNINTYVIQAYDYGINFFNEVKEAKMQIPSEIIQILEKSYSGLLDTLKTFLVRFFTGLVNTLTAIPIWFTYGFITILAVIFICFDRDYIISTCKKQIPKKWIDKIKLIYKETCNIVIEYIKAEAKLSGICFILVLTGLIIMGTMGIKLEYPVIMAILIGFIDLLPLFGAGAVMIPWTIYLIIIKNIPAAIGVGILWIIWAIIKNLLEPKMISKQMGIHPVFTLIGMYTGFKIFGVLGLMLGPITLLVLKNVFKEIINKGILKTIFEQD